MFFVDQPKDEFHELLAGVVRDRNRRGRLGVLWDESGRTCGADPPPVEVCGRNHKRKRNTMKCKNETRKA